MILWAWRWREKSWEPAKAMLWGWRWLGCPWERGCWWEMPRGGTSLQRHEKLTQLAQRGVAHGERCAAAWDGGVCE